MNVLKFKSINRGACLSLHWVMACILVVLFASCNEKFANLLDTEYPNTEGVQAGKNNKVLLITVDGVSGTALESIEAASMPTFTSMKKTSLYSMRSLTDYQSAELDYPIAYANLFTGVTHAKHKYGVENVPNNLLNYPSFIQRVKNEIPESQIGVFSANKIAVGDLVIDADVQSYFTTDDEVVTNAVTYLKNENPNIVTVNLVDADKAGTLVAYNAQDADYRAEIKKLDNKIRALKEALESRTSFLKENWLVVITSTQGANKENGTSGTSAYDDLRRNSFTMFYNPKLVSNPIAKPNTNEIPFTSISPVYNGTLESNNTALIPDDGGLYNFGTDEFTIRFTMKGNGTDATWPVFLSKGGRIDDNRPGWKLYISRKLLSMQVGGNGGQDNWENWGSDLVVNDGKWHNVVVVFFKEGNSRFVKIFVDGVKSGAVRNITHRPGFNTQEPLRIGRNRNDSNLPDIQVSHLQIYRGAWTDTEVVNNSCRVEVEPTSLKYNNLVGYWPSNEGKGTVLKNTATAGLGKDFILQGVTSWKSFSDITANLCPKVNDGFYKVVPNAVDVPFTIYSWLSIPVKPSWGLDGKVWPFAFNTIKP